VPCRFARSELCVRRPAFLTLPLTPNPPRRSWRRTCGSGPRCCTSRTCWPTAWARCGRGRRWWWGGVGVQLQGSWEPAQHDEPRSAAEPSLMRHRTQPQPPLLTFLACQPSSARRHRRCAPCWARWAPRSTTATPPPSWRAASAAR